eukprot:Nitzschia sp. Nitz4//scaffold369_size34440//28819//30358//NITZ4_007847-RA/size34440-processed-gene-0.18-mRNA-1//1//CDS//3329549380//4280//frame0
MKEPLCHNSSSRLTHPSSSDDFERSIHFTKHSLHPSGDIRMKLNSVRSSGPLHKEAEEPLSVHVRPANQQLKRTDSMPYLLAREMFEDACTITCEQALHETRDLPQFQLDEIVLGAKLGSGGFCDVLEVSAITLSKEHKEAKDDPTQENKEQTIDSKISRELRKFLSLHCRREGGAQDARYAIKQLRQDIRNDPPELCRAIVDINVEISILNKIEHPNIIKIRGLGAGPRFHDDVFVIMDRLYDTFGRRMKRWREEKNIYKGLVGKWQDPLQIKKSRLWRKRVLVALDLSSALSYLHSKRIIHRDIKPQNIGFDVRDDVKLFDFGLARELPDVGEATEDGLFHLSMCGSLRYMAPEVFCKKPYGETCDVYSVSILFWEMLSLKETFRKYDTDELMLKHVHSPPYQRPRVKPNWPTPLKDILQRAWHPLPTHRPQMHAVEDTLGQVLSRCSNPTRTAPATKSFQRKSTHVFHCDSSSTFQVDEIPL